MNQTDHDVHDSSPDRAGQVGPVPDAPAQWGPAYVRYPDGRWYPAPGLAPFRPQQLTPQVRRRHRLRNLVLVATTSAAVVAALLAGAGLDRHNTATAAAAIPTPMPALSAPAFPADDPGTQAAPLSAAAQAATARISPALVDINTTVGYGSERAAGTGIVLSSDGRVLTNHHVIAGATAMSVTDVGNGRTYRASVIGYDAGHDVAVLQLVDASGLATANLGESGSVTVGQSVVGVGNAGGVGGSPIAAEGHVTGVAQSITASDAGSGTAERLTGLISTDAQIQPGDSGGALVALDGSVVGMDTAGATSGADSTAVAPASTDSASTATAGFAVPIDQAMAVVSQIVSGQVPSMVHLGNTAFLGIEVARSGNAGPRPGSDAGSGSGGVLVGGIVSGTAADAAGLAAGDVITGIGDTPVTSSSALSQAMAAIHPGDQVVLRWTDAQGSAHTGTVTLTQGPVG